MYLGRREERRKEATERQAARAARTDQEQIERLEAAGHGHCREVARLRERIDAAAQEALQETAAESKPKKRRRRKR